MSLVNLKQEKRYYICTCLFHQREAKSFKDACKIDSDLCPSFKGDCGIKALLAEYELSSRTLQETFGSKFVPLSNTLATFLATCNSLYPATLRTERYFCFVRTFATDPERLAEYFKVSRLQKRT